MHRGSKTTAQAQQRREERAQRVKARFLAMTDPQRVELAETVRRRLGSRVKMLRGYTIKDFCLYGLEVVDTHGTLSMI